MNDLAFTLAQIREELPRSHFKILLKSLDLSIGDYDPDLRLSLGDVAVSAGAKSAWWCARCLDLNSMDVCRKVISVLIKSVERASIHAKDERVHGCINAVKQWLDGDDSVDLLANAKAAYAAHAAFYAAASAASYAADAAYSAVYAAYSAVYADSHAASAAAYAASYAAEEDTPEGASDDAIISARTAAYDAEREKQAQELIAAFPPLVLTESEAENAA